MLPYRLARGKTIKVVNLERAKDIKHVRNMCLESDVLLDPYRPGVIEKVGLNPLELLKENEKLIVARITGFGQTGELAQRFGRELNYVALSGKLLSMLLFH
ncbi:unnamed protein product [Anisakis simplex]|uniref:Uncharacterized protein n=1 Tax=Anisakis simplex TaxID=6269 RepID=A0A3P6NSY2_ANISI|nr:unnamed protein product [Anisakis simplex]